MKDVEKNRQSGPLDPLQLNVGELTESASWFLVLPTLGRIRVHEMQLQIPEGLRGAVRLPTYFDLLPRGYGARRC